MTKLRSAEAIQEEIYDAIYSVRQFNYGEKPDAIKINVSDLDILRLRSDFLVFKEIHERGTFQGVSLFVSRDGEIEPVFKSTNAGNFYLRGNKDTEASDE